jgi:hypothetical protein
MRVAAGRVDVQREPARLRERREDVCREAGLRLDPELRGWAASEVDRRARERVWSAACRRWASSARASQSLCRPRRW